MSKSFVPNSYYKFKLGNFNCISVSDGTFKYSPYHLFLGLNDDEVQKLLSDLNITTDQIVSPYTFLFVHTGDHKILVDMGAGRMGPNTGKLIDNLQKAGVTPSDIDTVLITHAHPDHVGGTLNDEGVPNYPNARYYLWKNEWDFWFSDAALEKVDEYLSKIIPTEVFIKIARGQLSPIKDSIQFITEEKEIFPGVFVHFAPGHTPGHMVISFESAGESLFFTSDTVLFPFFMEQKDLRTSLDISPELANSSKSKIFDLVTKKKALMLAQHFDPFPSLGHVLETEVGWKWKPIAVSNT